MSFFRAAGPGEEHEALKSRLEVLRLSPLADTTWAIAHFEDGQPEMGVKAVDLLKV